MLRLPTPSRDASPFGLGLPLAGGTLGRLRDRLLSPVLFGIYNRQAPELDAVRAELVAPPVRRSFRPHWADLGADTARG
jgi:hypothetical protein